jgi:hypothetical protein
VWAVEAAREVSSVLSEMERNQIQVRHFGEKIIDLSIDLNFHHLDSFGDYQLTT